MAHSLEFSQDSIDSDLDLSGSFPSWPSQAHTPQPEVCNVASGTPVMSAVAMNPDPGVLQPIQNVEANTHLVSQTVGSHPQLAVLPSGSPTPSRHKRNSELIVRVSLVPKLRCKSSPGPGSGPRDDAGSDGHNKRSKCGWLPMFRVA